MDSCSNEEDIARMIHKASWDAKNQRLALSFFKEEPENSVSRLCLITLPSLYKIFQGYSAWKTKLIGSGTVNIGDFQDIATPDKITVKPQPTKSNPAHAIIQEKVSRSTTDKLIKSGKIAIDVFQCQ